MTLASSLSTLALIPWGPIDLLVSRWHSKFHASLELAGILSLPRSKSPPIQAVEDVVFCRVDDITGAPCAGCNYFFTENTKYFTMSSSSLAET